MLALEAAGRPETAPPDFAGEHGWVLVVESSRQQWHGRACVPLARLLELPLTISVTHVEFLNSLPLFSVWKVGLWSLHADASCDVRRVSARLVPAFGGAGEGRAQV